MSVDDVSATVTFVMWLAFGLTAVALGLAWPWPRASAVRSGAAFAFGALCWSYNAAILLHATQPSTVVAGVVGLALGVATAALLGSSEWRPLRSIQRPVARVAAVITAWSVVAITLFALGGTGT